MNAWYNNTLDDNISDLAKTKADVDWMYRNFLGTGTNLAILYASDSVVKNANMVKAIEYAKTKNIKFGRAYSSLGEVNTVLAHNAANPTNKFVQMVTEIEPYNTGDYTGFYNIITQAYPKIKAAGMTHTVYMGWPTNAAWLPIVQNCDEINLHCYLKPTSMNESGIWGYVQGRLGQIAAACKQANKKIKLNIIYSCEPSFAGPWFSSHLS